jgi:hypothetical protein
LIYYQKVKREKKRNSEKKKLTAKHIEYYIDVRDCARLHVAALLDTSIKDERIFGFVHEYNWTDIIALLKALRPDNKLIPDPPANEWRDRSLVKSKVRAEQILHFFSGRAWTGFNASVEAGIEGF